MTYEADNNESATIDDWMYVHLRPNRFSSRLLDSNFQDTRLTSMSSDEINMIILLYSQLHVHLMKNLQILTSVLQTSPNSMREESIYFNKWSNLDPYQRRVSFHSQ